jgi:hypothetical protein
LQFSLPHVVDANLKFTINHSVSRIFQKIKMDWNINVVSFIFLVNP